MFEHMWLLRNSIMLGGQASNWDEFTDKIIKLNEQYWNAIKLKVNSRKKKLSPSTWSPPTLGDVKFNFDVSLFDNYVVTVVVLRNHSGYILGAWINCFFSSNLFCAEKEATIQNFDIDVDLKLDNATFEGDS